MKLSPASIGTVVITALIQLYCILLSTIFSIGRQQLSLFDANYALIITSSPFTIYLVYSSIRNLLGLETGLFERIESHRRVIGFIGALLLPLWLGLALTLRLSSKAFTDSKLCSDSTFWDFLLDLLLLFAPLTGPLGGVWTVLILFIAWCLLAIVGWLFMVAVSLLSFQGWDSLPGPGFFLSPLLGIPYSI